jgi:hypothetical protein
MNSCCATTWREFGGCGEMSGWHPVVTPLPLELELAQDCLRDLVDVFRL